MVNEIKELFDFVNSGGMSVYSRSRAASSQQEPREDVRITEVLNGLIVTRPAKKYTDLSKQPAVVEAKSESEPEVIDLQEYANSKAGSVPRRGINEVKELFDFHRSNGRFQV